jgi:hypothetical protein
VDLPRKKAILSGKTARELCSRTGNEKRKKIERAGETLTRLENRDPSGVDLRHQNLEQKNEMRKRTETRTEVKLHTAQIPEE